jgi:S-DNA-T family DNA segregation ATPase FtsK/SpoIIIE
MPRAPATAPPRSTYFTANHEVAAILLLCGGLLTLLALLTYAPHDGLADAHRVGNWIGPSGARWADSLLQVFGVGAYAVGLGLWVAGWRALRGRRVAPGPREAAGLVLSMVSLDALAYLLMAGHFVSYPAGGIPGVLLGPVLVDGLGRVGGFVVGAAGLAIGGILQRPEGGLRAGLRRLEAGFRWGQAQWPPLRHQLARRVAAALAGLRQLLRWGWQRLRRPGRLAAVTGAKALSASTAFELADLAESLPAVAPDEFSEQPVLIKPRHTSFAGLDLGSAPAPESTTAPAAEPPTEASAAPTGPGAEHVLPPIHLLDMRPNPTVAVDPDLLRQNAAKLTQTLKDYNIDGYVREIRPGPVVTLYEYVPGPGIKIAKIASLADDLAMSMEAMRVRIVAPIPGKGAVGIEIPNEVRETVFLKELLAHPAFVEAPHKLTLALGKDIEGAAYVADLAGMPHLLVAGATGAGKSVSVNAMIMSLLFRCTPDDVRMIMVDPKMLELSVYDGIPHLLLPVVTDPKKAALALRWAVEEMERRYEVLSEMGVRSIDGYNNRVRAAAAAGAPLEVPRLPYILVVVDELADLMMVASREVETSIMRLAQMARAAGIHLILATQRPSVDVLTGVIKANFPTRIAFQVASRHDSRTILDGNGAEHLLGRGDMLFLSPGAGGLVRVHGAYVSEEEIARAVDHLKAQGTPQYDESILAPRDDEEEAFPSEDFADEMYDQAVALVAEAQQASISMIQRRLRIGYNRSARMVERMQMEGIVGPGEGGKPRPVLVSDL